MYTYCGNNPANAIDNSGHAMHSTNTMMTDSGGGFIPIPDSANYTPDFVQYCQFHGYTFSEGIQNYNSFSIEFIDDISEDISNFSFANTDENTVLNSHYFSAYRGTLVIRTNGDRSGTVGIMFLSRKTNSQPDAIDTVRHEYGHAVQLREMGLVNFMFAIGIPSALNLGSGKYYDKPWEITADILGNVQSRTHSTYNVIRGATYYVAGTISFVAAYLTLR